MAKVVDDTWRLRARADELRAIGDGFRDEHARSALMGLADDYDWLANQMRRLTPMIAAGKRVPGWR